MDSAGGDSSHATSASSERIEYWLMTAQSFCWSWICAAVWITTSRTDHFEQSEGADQELGGNVRSIPANSAWSESTNFAVDWTNTICRSSFLQWNASAIEEYRGSTPYGEEFPRT